MNLLIYRFIWKSYEYLYISFFCLQKISIPRNNSNEETFHIEKYGISFENVERYQEIKFALEKKFFFLPNFRLTSLPRGYLRTQLYSGSEIDCVKPCKMSRDNFSLSKSFPLFLLLIVNRAWIFLHRFETSWRERCMNRAVHLIFMISQLSKVDLLRSNINDNLRHCSCFTAQPTRSINNHQRRMRRASRAKFDSEQPRCEENIIPR